jgi:CIC family chloride channel protein
MAAFFGCVANTPLTSLFIVCDITGGYELLIPSMLAIMIGYALTGRWTICTKQMENRARSPAHRKELVVDVLEELKVKDAMTKDVITIGPEEKASIIPLLIEREHHLGFPVIKNDELIGIVTFRDVEKTSPEDRDRITIEEIASKRLIVSYTDETLEDALRKLVTRDIRRLPVVDRDDPSRLLGMITESDIVRAHARERSEG